MSSSVVARLEQLAVEQTDPFFFDHPLDHVPGMVLFDELLRAALDAHAEHTGDAQPSRVRAGIDFTKICELDQPTTLSCAPADGRDGWSAAAVQDGRTVCAATFAFEVGPPPAHGPVPAPGEFTAPPAPAALVHRTRPENILVGELTRPPLESLLLDPPAGHVLLGLDPAHRSATELVEAARQLIAMLAHTEGGAAMDDQMLWLSLTIDIPARVPRGVPLVLRCLEHNGESPRVICTLLLAEAATGAELGMLNFVTRNIEAERYAKMRVR